MPTMSRARTTTDGPRSVLDLKRPPTAPGEMLLEEFLRPAGLTQVEAARRMKIPLNRLNEIIRALVSFAFPAQRCLCGDC